MTGTHCTLVANVINLTGALWFPCAAWEPEGFWLDLVAAIEQVSELARLRNRSRSRATARILRLSRSQRWPKDEIQVVHVIWGQALSTNPEQKNDDGNTLHLGCPNSDMAVTCQ